MPELGELYGRFKFERVLASDSQVKSVAVLGSIDSQPAIISLEKTHFDEKRFLDQVQEISQINGNDIYYWGMNVLRASLQEPSSKINLIYPATEKHIKKYDTQKFHIVHETPAMYAEIVEPYIATMKGSRIQWVKNILFNNYEADKIVYKDDEIVLLPDMKWDGVTMASLYLVSIVKREDISSVRDLNADHVEYLEKIALRILQETSRHYDIKADELRLFVHYQPSYYHFHIHVVNVQHPGLGLGIAAGKAILLEEVIDNLKFLGAEGYRSKTITYAMGENHDLWSRGFKEEHEKYLKSKGLE